MAELEWLREKLVAPGLLPADRVEAWLTGWAPERPLLLLSHPAHGRAHWRARWREGRPIPVDGRVRPGRASGLRE